MRNPFFYLGYAWHSWVTCPFGTGIAKAQHDHQRQWFEKMVKTGQIKKEGEVYVWQSQDAPRPPDGAANVLPFAPLAQAPATDPRRAL